MARVVVHLLVALLCVLSIYGCYQLVRNSWYLLVYDHVQARISTCEAEVHRRVGAGKSLPRGGRLRYAPIVKVDGGISIKGAVYSSGDACYDGVGSDVLVVLDPSDRSNGYIVTFAQYWLGPLALFLGPALANFIFMIPIMMGINKISR